MSANSLTGLSRLRRFNGAALLAMAAVELVYGVISIQYLELLFADPVNLDQEWAGFQARHDRVVSIYSIILVACNILGATWVYGAVRNADLLDPDRQRISPGWAIGWHLVPIANFFMPYRAMKQTYNSSTRPARELDAPLPRLFPVWWGFWLATNMAVIIPGFIYGDATPSDRMLVFAGVTDVVLAPLSVVAIYLWWMVITRITDLQGAPRPGAFHSNKEVIQ